MLHFRQDCVPGMWKLASDMDFYVYMNHPTATVTYTNNKLGFFSTEQAESNKDSLKWLKNCILYF